MKGGKPVLVSAGLALAAHAALLLGPPGPHAGRQGAAAAPAVTARLAVEAPAPAALEPSPPEPELTPAPTTAPPPIPSSSAQEAAAQAAPSPDAAPPLFEAARPSIGFPDAPLPADGVQLRAYVELEADGSPRAVSTGSPPGVVVPPLGFQKVTEIALRQARFKAGQGSAYCLLVNFEPDVPTPRLAWLPGAARDASRCLTGMAPAPRDIDVATAP